MHSATAVARAAPREVPALYDWLVRRSQARACNARTSCRFQWKETETPSVLRSWEATHLPEGTSEDNGGSSETFDSGGLGSVRNTPSVTKLFQSPAAVNVADSFVLNRNALPLWCVCVIIFVQKVRHRRRKTREAAAVYGCVVDLDPLQTCSTEGIPSSSLSEIVSVCVCVSSES